MAKHSPTINHHSEPALVLGIDAGGTKTAAAIGDAHAIFGQAVVGPGNIQVVSEAKLIHNLRTAVRLALNKSAHQLRRQYRLARQHVRFQNIVIGMAGIDCRADERKADRLVRQALALWANSRTQWHVMNDVQIVLRSGSEQSYGMAIIAGTGAHGYGINKAGQTARVSGLGYLIADEGAGYWIGMQAIRAAARAWDKRSAPTGLERALLKYCRLHSFRDLLPWIRQANKADIARLSLVVEAEAMRGDRIAKQILDSGVNELVLNVNTLTRELRMRRAAFDLVVIGGNFMMRGYPFLAEFTRRVKKVAPKARVVFPSHPPVIGAVRLAQDLL